MYLDFPFSWKFNVRWCFLTILKLSFTWNVTSRPMAGLWQGGSSRRVYLQMWAIYKRNLPKILLIHVTDIAHYMLQYKCLLHFENTRHVCLFFVLLLFLLVFLSICFATLLSFIYISQCVENILNLNYGMKGISLEWLRANGPGIDKCDHYIYKSFEKKKITSINRCHHYIGTIYNLKK